MLEERQKPVLKATIGGVTGGRDDKGCSGRVALS